MISSILKIIRYYFFLFFITLAGLIFINNIRVFKDNKIVIYNSFKSSLKNLKLNIIEYPKNKKSNYHFDNNTKVTRKEINDIVEQASKKYGIPEKLIHAIIKVESDYNQFAISHKGARGLMQLMPDTAKEMGVSNPFDAYQNIIGAVKYLKQLLDRYNNNIDLALAAYNAGAEKVKGNRIPEIKETLKYIRKVKKLFV